MNPTDFCNFDEYFVILSAAGASYFLFCFILIFNMFCFPIDK